MNLPATLAASMIAVALTLTHAASTVSDSRLLQGGCTGCTGSENFFNNIPGCIHMVVEGLDCQSGSCNGSSSPCAEQPCTMFGDISITNLCAGPLWIRTKRNTTCEPGTTEVPPGDVWNVSYNGDSLDCGVQFLGRVYTSDPGKSCPTASAAGWYFTCTACGTWH